MRIIKTVIYPEKQVFISHSVKTEAGEFWRASNKPVGISGDGQSLESYSRTELAIAAAMFGCSFGESARAWAQKQMGVPARQPIRTPPHLKGDEITAWRKARGTYGKSLQ